MSPFVGATVLQRQVDLLKIQWPCDMHILLLGHCQVCFKGYHYWSELSCLPTCQTLPCYTPEPRAHLLHWVVQEDYVSIRPFVATRVRWHLVTLLYRRTPSAASHTLQNPSHLQPFRGPEGPGDADAAYFCAMLAPYMILSGALLEFGTHRPIKAPTIFYLKIKNHSRVCTTCRLQTTALNFLNANKRHQFTDVLPVFAEMLDALHGTNQLSSANVPTNVRFTVLSKSRNIGRFAFIEYCPKQSLTTPKLSLTS